MIKTRNLGHFTVSLKSPGVNTTGNGKDSCLVPFDGFISNIVACCAAAGSGTYHTVVDVNYEGASIFTAATKVTLASTTGVASYSALTALPYSVTNGAKITLDVDQISTTMSGINVDITFSKTPPAAATNLTNLNTVI